MLTLTETARFDGDRIIHLEDQYTTEMREETDRYVLDYGAKLGLELAVGALPELA